MTIYRILLPTQYRTKVDKTGTNPGPSTETGREGGTDPGRPGGERTRFPTGKRQPRRPGGPGGDGEDRVGKRPAQVPPYPARARD